MAEKRTKAPEGQKSPEPKPAKAKPAVAQAVVPDSPFAPKAPPGADADRAGIAPIRFGKPGARPKAYLQAGLHADELPGLLVLRHLTAMLEERAACGEIIGEIVIVRVANPIGLAQRTGDMLVGRAELGSERNFNRGFTDLTALAKACLHEPLGADGEANVAAVRAAMAEGLEALLPADAFEAQQHQLVRHSFDADIVLDLHADNEALMHLYTLPAFWPEAEDLAAELDARAVLLCADSGGATFDEALSVPWVKLAADFPEAVLPPACFSATVELRSNNEVDSDLADRDARALLRFLIRRGVVDGNAGGLPRLLCEATALEAMQQIRAPIEGVVVYRPRLGDTVRAGEVIAEIIPPVGESVEVQAETDGLLFARHNQRWAWPGRIIAKIAGTTPLPGREGSLLSP